MEKISSATGPLYHALECGIVSEVRQALEMGQLDVNTLFQDAVNTYTSGAVEARGRPLHVAARWGDTELIDLLLERGADINGTYRLGRTPLMEAVAAGRSEVARQLMQAGADVSAIDVESGTALHIAAGCGLVGLIQSLLECGADVNGTYKYGRTPLHDAAAANQADAARLLIFSGAAVDAEDIDGCTPLLACCTPEMAALLLDNGAELNAAPRPTGETLLHAAASTSNLELARHLLDRGADIFAEDKLGRTPLDVFREGTAAASAQKHLQQQMQQAQHAIVGGLTSPRGPPVPTLQLSTPGPSPGGLGRGAKEMMMGLLPGWTPRQEELCRLLLRAAAEGQAGPPGSAPSVRSGGRKSRVRMDSLDNPRTSFVHRVGADPRQQDMQEVLRWLHERGLSHYWEALHEVGVRTLEDLALVTEADLAECGLRPIQRRRFFRTLQIASAGAAAGRGAQGAGAAAAAPARESASNPPPPKASGLETFLLVIPIVIGVIGLFGRSLHLPQHAGDIALKTTTTVV